MKRLAVEVTKSSFRLPLSPQIQTCVLHSIICSRAGVSLGTTQLIVAR